MIASKEIYTIPNAYAERKSLRELIDSFVSSCSLVPPVSMDNLHDLSDRMIKDFSLDPEIKGWLMVEINNCVWKEVVASIPYEKGYCCCRNA